MGVCVSTQTDNERGGMKLGEWDSTIKVVHMDGLVEEFAGPIKSTKITSRNPSLFLCNCEQMSIGSCVPQLSDDDDLQLGHIYFLIPRSQAHKPLSLPDLCNYAIKASSALREHTSPPAPVFREMAETKLFSCLCKRSRFFHAMRCVNEMETLWKWLVLERKRRGHGHPHCK